MPTTSASSAAAIDNSSVAGNRSLSSVDTGRPWRNDSPKSPCTALPTKRANCTNGWSSPSSVRSRAWSCERRVLPDHERDRIAGEIEQAERDECHHRHHGDRLQDAAKDEGGQFDPRRVSRRPDPCARRAGLRNAPMMPNPSWSVNAVPLSRLAAGAFSLRLRVARGEGWGEGLCRRRFVVQYYARAALRVAGELFGHGPSRFPPQCCASCSPGSASSFRPFSG